MEKKKMSLAEVEKMIAEKTGCSVEFQIYELFLRGVEAEIEFWIKGMETWRVTSLDINISDNDRYYADCMRKRCEDYLTKYYDLKKMLLEITIAE